MDKELMIFNNDMFGNIRVINIDGNVWFVAKDVAEALGYKNPRRAISMHIDEDDVTKCYITDSIGRQQEMTFINESGLYSLILGSKLPSAKQFKRWITSEVLPQIRKTGGYIPVVAEETPEQLMARAVMVAQRTLEERDKQLAQVQAVNAILAPKAAYCDQVLKSENTYTATVVAKQLGLKSANQLNKILVEEKIIMKKGNFYMFRAAYADKGYGHLETQTYTTKYGGTAVKKQLRFTEAGIKFLYELLKKHGYIK